MHIANSGETVKRDQKDKYKQNKWSTWWYHKLKRPLTQRGNVFAYYRWTAAEAVTDRTQWNERTSNEALIASYTCSKFVAVYNNLMGFFRLFQCCRVFWANMCTASVSSLSVILRWNSHINFPSVSFLLVHICSRVINMNQSNLGLKRECSPSFCSVAVLVVLPHIPRLNFISQELWLINGGFPFFALKYVT